MFFLVPLLWGLPLSSLRLLVPPLRLVSAALWQVVQQRDVMDYGLVEEFVTTVLEIVPDMMSYRERVQLIMGLRAQVRDANPETIQPHLNRMKTCIITHRGKEVKVEASQLTFRKLIQTLLEDPIEKEHFFQNIFPEEFGPKYNSALQTLVWEFLSRLEKLLPAPTLQQTASWFLPDPSVLEECVQCVSHPQHLKTLLQHHNNTCGHVDTNGRRNRLWTGNNVSRKPITFPCLVLILTFLLQLSLALSSGDNQILASMSLSSLVIDEAFTDQADPEVQSEPEQECMSPVSSDNEPKMASLLEHMESELLPLNKEVKPAFLEVACRHKKTTAKNNTSFHHLHTDSGLKIQGKAHSSQQEVQDISSLSTSCRLRQPKVLLHRLDITDMLLPVTEVSSTPRRERLQIDKVGSQGQRRGQVISQKSERNINEEPSDGQPQYSLAPDPSLTTGQPKRNKRVKICSLCGKTFSEAKDLTAHMRCHNEQSPSKCTQCGQDFEHHEDLQKHQQNVCEAAAQPEEDMSTASFKEDNMSMTSVEDDWTEISHPHDTLPQNKRGPYVHHTPKAFQPSKARQICHVCHKTLCNVFMLRRHLKSVHGLLPYNHRTSPENPTTSKAPPTGVILNSRTCLVCYKTFFNRASLLQHRRRHSQGQGPHTCTICSRSFGRAFDLTRHQARKTGCGSMHRNLVVHENAPTEVKPVFSCPHCQEWFTSENKLETHMLCHTGEGFTCRFCGKMFAKQYKLYIHVRSHIDRPHLCDACGKDFRTKYALKVHTRVHTGERPFSCPDCGKRCSSKGNLKAHQQSHTGERPFACPLCKVRCRIKSQLKVHILTHTGERPHKCLACGKTFQLKLLLRKHQSASCS
uniref:C2H2-type domain-containing protein n=1 Tax=Oncorhynchus mykiss TaxID=8022 RepID=A0A8K9UB51_ONCMY